MQIKIIQISLISVLYSLLQSIVFVQLIALPFGALFVDTMLFTALLVAAGYPLWNLMKYANVPQVSNAQRVINSIGFGVLSITVALLVNMGAVYLFFGEAIYSGLLMLVPLKALIGGLIYLVMLFGFNYFLTIQQEQSIDRQSETQESAEASIPQPPEPALVLLEKISVRTGAKINIVELADILYLQADGDYVQIHTSTGNHLKEDTMKYFEQHLPPDRFVRVHRSYIVNVKEIRRIELFEKQSQLLTLSNGEKIKASPSGYKLLKERMKL